MSNARTARSPCPATPRTHHARCASAKPAEPEIVDVASSTRLRSQFTQACNLQQSTTSSYFFSCSLPSLVVWSTFVASSMARQTEGKQQQGRPPRAFGGWEGGAQPDYSLDFTKIRAAGRRSSSWSSFVGNANAAVEQPPPGANEDRHHQWSSAASEGDDDHLERRRRHRPRYRRLRSDAADRDDRQPIRPGRAATPKGRGKFKGYLFGCVGGLW